MALNAYRHFVGQLPFEAVEQHAFGIFARKPGDLVKAFRFVLDQPFEVFRLLVERRFRILILLDLAIEQVFFSTDVFVFFFEQVFALLVAAFVFADFVSGDIEFAGDCFLVFECHLLGLQLAILDDAFAIALRLILNFFRLGFGGANDLGVHDGRDATPLAK